jgi:hypothetical protein
MACEIDETKETTGRTAYKADNPHLGPDPTASHVSVIVIVNVEGSQPVSGQCAWAVRTAPDYGDNLKAVKGALTTPNLRRIAWKPSYDSFDLNYSDFAYKSSLLILGSFLIISSICDILIL